MKNLSFAFEPGSRNIKLKVFMNVEDNRGNLGVDDHLLFEKTISIPVNVWNLILELNEE